MLVGWLGKRTSAQSSEPKAKPPHGQFVAGELLVRFRSEEAADQEKLRGGRLQIAGREVQLHIDRPGEAQILSGLRLVRTQPEDTLKAIEALNERADVLYAEPNYIREPLSVPNDPLYPDLWGLHNTGSIFGSPGLTPGIDIDAEEAWNITIGSRDVVVGVVDGGIDVSHPDLQDNIWRNPAETANNGIDDDQNGFIDDVNGFDFFHNRADVFDPQAVEEESHATHVAGTIGAVGNNGTGVVGVNWQVSLISLKVLGPQHERPYPSNVMLLVRAWVYAKKMRDLWVSSGGANGADIRVLNNSLGGYGRSQTELDAVRELNSSGVLFVCAAGNYGRNNDIFPLYPAGYDSPNVISVAASHYSEALAGFTNVGARSVTLSAPGITIESTTAFGQYGIYNGTSMASPHVAGAAALICATHPTISVRQLKAALIYNGDLVESQKYKTLTGRRLNAFKALKAAEENDITPPASIMDFRIVAQNGRSITLAWTAPGDDGNIETSSLYDIRYTDQVLTSDEQFDAATPISPLAIPYPSKAGTWESATIELPFQHTGGYLLLRATDNLGNDSPIAELPVSTEPRLNHSYDITESAPQHLSVGGTTLPLLGDDDVYALDFALPFAFPFFGHWFRNVTVSSNGALYFSPPPKFLLPPITSDGSLVDFYSSRRALQTNMMIAGMWDDLIKNPAGMVFLTPDPNRVIFRWEGTTFDTPFDDGTTRGRQPINFEIELWRDGTIQIRYGDGNQRLFPVVGISGGGPDAYVVDSHTSESVFLNLTNANTVTFTPRFPPVQPSADLQVIINGVAVKTDPAAEGVALPAAAVPGQILEYGVVVTDLGPDPAENVVLTAHLPAGTSFVGCLEKSCSGPPVGTDGGTFTMNLGTLGEVYDRRASGGEFQVRVNAPSSTTLVASFEASSSTPDLNLKNNKAQLTTVVAGFSDFRDVVAATGARIYTMALRRDGSVWFWGIPFESPESAVFGLTTPRRVAGLSNVTAIACGFSHALALESDGSVWSWGWNDRGQLGNQPEGLGNAFPPTRIPQLAGIQSIAASGNSSFAVDSDGSVWAWGYNDSGELGDGTAFNTQPVPIKLNTISSVRTIATTGSTTYAIKQDGTLWSWGSNALGSLGTGTTEMFSPFPAQITGLTNVRAVAARYIHAMAIKSDGTVWVWGSGVSGELGNGTNDSSSVPLQVSGLTSITAIAAADVSCLALKSDGGVWTWGGGQRLPVQVTGLSNVTAIGSGSGVYLAILSNGALKAWGYGSYGNLGNGTLMGSTTPVQVKSLEVVKAPSFDTKGGTYTFPIDVSINCETEGAVIHYTTNGVDPTEFDPVINIGAAVRVDHSLVLKGKAWKTGWAASAVTSVPYTILATGNPIDEPWTFIRQQYLDFLGRQPDRGGWDYWIGQISSCGGDQVCVRDRRIRVADAFFFEPEFQQTGSFVLRLYRAAYGNNQPFPNPDVGNPSGPFYPGPEFHLKFPSYGKVNQDRAQVVGGPDLAQSQLTLANDFAQRPEFLARYTASLNGPAFITAILESIRSASGSDLTSQVGVLNGLYDQGGRGLVLFHLANDYWNGCGSVPAPCVPPGTGMAVDNRSFINAEYNFTFVSTEYFGYLRRDGDANGLNFWLAQVNRFPIRDADAQHAMVCSFITSAEYQLRFGSVVSQTNQECPQ